MEPPLIPAYSLIGSGFKAKLDRETNHTCCHANGSFEQPDEDGAELAKEARVWRVYVKETDRWDAEKVDGWNKSLDVMLVFAALFSAVLTTFLIESSRMLKQDPDDTSAAALSAIFQVVVTIATNSSSDPSVLRALDQGAFVPTPQAILINTIWYLSLSLSIATSFLAMLAKDWCHSFYADRTGHPYKQAHKRQLKWMMIERWKMQEVILVLPSLIHLSLLLFAIELCLYVWDLNITPAIPIVCITTAALSFYLLSSIASSIFEYFPYTTILSAMYRSKPMRAFYRRTSGLAAFVIGSAIVHISMAIQSIEKTIYCIYAGLVYLVHSPWILYQLGRYYYRNRLSRSTASVLPIQVQYTGHFLKATVERLSTAGKIIQSLSFDLPFNIRDPSLDDARLTSHSLGWLIRNCETPRSVAIALQAIAGASSVIPKEPLYPGKASLQIFQRLISLDRKNRKTANTYARALKFLRLDSTSGTTDTDYGDISDIKVFIWDHKLKHEQELVDLIQDKEQPNLVLTEENLNALSIGNTATLHSMSALDGDCQDAAKTLNEIASILFGTFDLHPVVFKVLINAASLLLSCSKICAVSIRLAGLCIEKQHELGGKLHPRVHEPTTFKRDPVSGAVLVLHGLMGKRSLAATRKRKDLPAFRALMEESEGLLRQLFNKRDTWTGEHWKTHLWLQCTKLLSFPKLYDIERSEDFIPLENWCQQQLADSLSLLLILTSQHGDQGFAQTHAVEFLWAFDQVYYDGISSRPRHVPWSLPQPLYPLLATISASFYTYPADLRMPPLFDWSYGPFPQLTSILVRNLDTRGSVSLFGKNLRNDVVVDFRARHFSAIQLWLLLYLAGDSTTDDQKNLKKILERDSGLDIEARGINWVRGELGSYIIQTYRTGWHLGLYTYRAIECILQAHKIQGYQGLAQYIEATLNAYQVAQELRGLTSFSSPPAAPMAIITEPIPDPATAPVPPDLSLVRPLPPSPAPSLPVSRAELEGAPQITEEPRNTGHVSVDIKPDSSILGEQSDK